MQNQSLYARKTEIARFLIILPLWTFKFKTGHVNVFAIKLVKNSEYTFFIKTNVFWVEAGCS